MAKLRVYSVYDSKIEGYRKPFFMESRGEALRSWQKIVNDEKTMFCEHPEDFTLFEMAEYDEDSGRFENHSTPISLGVAIEFKKPKLTQVQQ